jgi:hypothetical protein
MTWHEPLLKPLPNIRHASSSTWETQHRTSQSFLPTIFGHPIVLYWTN